MTGLDSLWDNLLSRDPKRVRSQWRDLSEEERRAVCAHLQRMVREGGWHPAQRESAQAALDALPECRPPR